MMRVPMMNLQAQLAPYREAALAAMTRVVDSQQLIMGPEVAGFERELADYSHVDHAIGVSSGTDALLVALMALGVGPGDEVVTTPFSFFATAGVVARLGAIPVFADIDPRTFNLTEAGVRAAITERTRAIIVVHLYGQMCDLGDLYETCEIPIIEDAAQSIGSELRGRGTGHFGAFSCISFYPAKNLGAFGDAGAVLCQDPDLAERVRILRVHGSKPKYYHHLVGGNFRLDAIQAAVLRVKLPLLDSWAQGRQANAARYDALFTSSGLVESGHVTLPLRVPQASHVFNQYVIRVDQRDALKSWLADAGVDTMVYYPGPLHLQPCFAHLGHQPGDFPNAEKACQSVLALPIAPELPGAALPYIVEQVGRFFASNH